MKHLYIVAAAFAALASALAVAQPLTPGKGLPGLRVTRQAPTRVVSQSATSLRAPSRALAAASDLITEQPQGTLYQNLYRYSRGYFSYQGALYEGEADGYTSDVVLADDGTFYLKDPFGLSPTNTWLKGRKTVGDTIVVDLPQPVMQVTSGSVTNTRYAYKMEKMEWPLPDGTLMTTYMAAPDEEQHIAYVWRNDSIIKADSTQLLGLCDADGNWLDFGEEATELTRVTDVAPAPQHPEEAHTCALFFGIDDGSSDMRIVTATTEGNQFYMKDFYDQMPDAWVKGTIENGKVVFEGPQYMGILESADAHIYFSPARNDTIADESGQLMATATLRPHLEFSYDEATGVMATDSAFVVNIGKHLTNALLDYAHITIEPWTETAATPVAPEIVTYRPYNASDRYGLIGFRLLKTGTNNEVLNPQKLFYNVYFDDEMVTLTPAEYKRLTEPMTDIPCNFTDYTDIYTSGYLRLLYFFRSDLSRVGVRLFYTGGGEKRYSHIVYTDGTTDIQTATADRTPAGVTYTDLSGRRVSEAQRGIVLKTTRYTDGTLTTEKVVK